MKSSINRRNFLRTSAMAAATAAVNSRALGDAGALMAAPAAAAGKGGISWDKAPCRFCGTGCHVKVGVEGGKVVAVAGQPGRENWRLSLVFRRR